MVQGTAQRVSRNTAREVNEQIKARIADSVRWHAEHPDGIDRRLRELDKEWDIERTLEANASTLAFTGVVLGATFDRRWLVLPAVVTAFLFQHAVQGWCPPLPILRRLGFRTMREIDIERYSLKALRGNFGQIGPGPRNPDTRANRALQAAML